jgi:sarcosine oxidase subunit beta
MADVIIIGSGVIGNSCALQLNRKGFRTLNIDKGPAAGSGSTSYSSGNLRSMYTALTSTMFADEGYHFWQGWADNLGLPSDTNTGIAQYRESGGGIIWTTASSGFLESCYVNHDHLGIPYEILDSADLVKRFPVFDTTAYYPPRRIDDPLFGTPSDEHRFYGAGYFPQAGYVSDPMLAANNVMSAAKATGRSEYLFNTEVKSIDKTNGRVSGVTTADGDKIEAPIVLNVGGPHSAQITALAFADSGVENDMNVTTRAMRTEVAYVQSMPEFPYHQDGPTFADFDVGVYWRPQVGGQILIGSIEPECDNEFHQHLSDADRLDTGFTEQMTNQIYRAALRMPTLPIPSGSDTAGIVAMYDVSNDWIPIYDKSAIPGYYMAIGTSGNQFKCTGPAGLLVSSIIDYVENGGEHDEEPLHVAMPITGHEIDASFYSRLRAQSHETSGTVMG